MAAFGGEYVYKSRRSLSPDRTDSCRQRIPMTLFAPASSNTTPPHSHPFPSHLLPMSTKIYPFKCMHVLTEFYTRVWLINFRPCTTCSNHTGHAWSALQPTDRTLIKGHTWERKKMHHCNCYMPNLVEHCISFRLLSAIDLCYCNPIDFHNCTQWAISH